MVLPPHFRKLLTFAMAGGLGACASAGPTAPLAVVPTTATTMSLVSRSNPLLVIGNLAAPAVADSKAVQKTVDDVDLQALLDRLAGEGSFEHSAPVMPPGAAQVLVLRHGERQWCWSAGGAAEARTAAFVRSRSGFLELFNRANAYHPADRGAERELIDSARRAGARGDRDPARQQ